MLFLLPFAAFPTRSLAADVRVEDNCDDDNEAVRSFFVIGSGEGEYDEVVGSESEEEDSEGKTWYQLRITKYTTSNPDIDARQNAETCKAPPGLSFLPMPTEEPCFISRRLFFSNRYSKVKIKLTS